MLDQVQDQHNMDQLTEDHMEFILRTLRRLSGRYLSPQDDEFAVALEAFQEALDRYEAARGAFLPFAALVIESRVKNAWEKESKQPTTRSIEELWEAGYELPAPEPPSLLLEEIEEWKRELACYGLSLDRLEREAPRHQDTRCMALDLARRISEEEGMMEIIRREKRLPVRALARHFAVSEKRIKGSRSFILGSVLLFSKDDGALKRWVGERSSHD